MKILALDIGDRWTGIAISDPLGVLARPYNTIKTSDLSDFLQSTFQKESISCVIVGLPTTLRGTESNQTKKVIAFKEELENKFSSLEWKLWDERFSSKQAATIKSTKTKEDKLRSHALAAAVILSTYLDYKRFYQTPTNNFY